MLSCVLFNHPLTAIDPTTILGGIPERDIEALERYWKVCPQLRQALFKENRSGYVDLRVEKAEIKTTIYEHSEFVELHQKMDGVFTAWRKGSAAMLKALQAGCHPKEIIATLSEGLLRYFTAKPLIDKYDVY